MHGLEDNAPGAAGNAPQEPEGTAAGAAGNAPQKPEGTAAPGEPAAIPEFVEAMGLRMAEDVGMPPMAGRVLGWLLVCDPPEQTAADLARALKASKGSISAAVRMLTRPGLIDRITVPGERTERFRLRPQGWAERLRATDEMRRFRAVLEQGLEALADAPPARRARLEQLDEFYAWLEARMPQLWDEWEARER